MAQKHTWILQAYHYGRPSDIDIWTFPSRRAAVEYMRYHHDGPIYWCDRFQNDWYYSKSLKSGKFLYRILRRDLIREHHTGIYVESWNHPDSGPLRDKSKDRDTQEPEEDKDDIPDTSPVAVPSDW